MCAAGVREAFIHEIVFIFLVDFGGIFQSNIIFTLLFAVDDYRKL